MGSSAGFVDGTSIVSTSTGYGGNLMTLSMSRPTGSFASFSASGTLMANVCHKRSFRLTVAN